MSACLGSYPSDLPPLLQGEFVQNIKKIHEKTKQRDEEIEGGWYTEEKMHKELNYTTQL